MRRRFLRDLGFPSALNFFKISSLVLFFFPKRMLLRQRDAPGCDQLLATLNKKPFILQLLKPLKVFFFSGLLGFSGFSAGLTGFGVGFFAGGVGFFFGVGFFLFFLGLTGFGVGVGGVGGVGFFFGVGIFVLGRALMLIGLRPLHLSFFVVLHPLQTCRSPATTRARLTVFLESGAGGVGSGTGSFFLTTLGQRRARTLVSWTHFGFSIDASLKPFPRLRAADADAT